MSRFFNWLEHNRDWGIFLLRAFIGFRLVYGVLDNVLSWDHMIKFRDFLREFHFPFPMVCAVVSVYAQLFAGIMFLVGWKIRYAAIMMIINFAFALIMVHHDHTVEAMTAPLSILFCSVLFLFQGAGRIAIDKK